MDLSKMTNCALVLMSTRDPDGDMRKHTINELARRLEAAEAANKALNTATEIERLRELVAFNEDQRRMLFDAAIKLEAERDRWKAIAEKRHAILLDLEWIIDAKDGDGSYCPYCMSMDDEVHVAGCKMAEAIAKSARAANGEVSND